MLSGLLRTLGAAALSATLLVAAAPTGVLADERTCRGTLGSITVDNLRVPSGAKCDLRGTRVKGTIKVGSKATLRAFGVRVVGNVQGENSSKVVVRNGSRVGGNVQVVQSGVVKVLDSRINGDIQVDANRGRNNIRRNVVGGNIQAFQNSGGVEIYRNRVDGNLQCKSNSPRPVGARNVVQGNKEDQCRRL
ncbi:hypothetical protein BH24CHL6_BH24CHL6_13620 [soil metagenome]